jgi:two-component system nitrogen regulation sensor histidine kinase GlnL
MEDEISRLENFITQFLGSTASPDEIKSVDINALIGRIKVFVSLQTYAHNITCEYELGKIPPLMANPFHLEQAILNVINNAIEAMKSQGTLTIKTYAEKKPEGQFIVIEVIDTGQGMDVANIKDRELDHTKGRGFGLFIAHEMVKYYSGRLEIRGEKGKGTTVRFYLPCRDTAKE